jgi:cobalt-zinc-cadmium efflux system outer membrane protein
MFRFILPLGLAALFSTPVYSQTPFGSPVSADKPDAGLSVPARDVKVWSLADSIRRALDIAPELRVADAEIAAREAELEQAVAWPNPTMDVRADNRLGIEDGSGGSGLTQIALSQPLPLRRIARQRAVAEANLDSARENLRYRKLLLEREVAGAFQALQLADARLRLAEERLQLVGESPAAARISGADRLMRYLTPLERQRLAILNEEASQALAAAGREQQKALLDFRTRLALPDGMPLEVTELVAPDAPVSLDVLLRTLDAHPALAAARKESEAAQTGIAAAESQRYADPSLNLFRERDYLAGQRRDVTGVGISVQIPLWSTGSGAVAKAKAEAGRASAQFAMTRRDARIRLEQAHTELLRLLDQSARLSTKLLEPARRVFVLTRRGFASGELNLLTLVDASNTYFDARLRHLQLQQESARATADLRLAAGLSIVDGKEAQP